MNTYCKGHKTALMVGGVFLMVCGLVTGCGIGSSETSSVVPVAVVGGAFKGSTHGGQQPVSGSTIQLYAAGSTGYGSAYSYASGTSLLGSTVVTSDASGNFTIPPGSYTCPSANTETYIVAQGGNPGLPQSGGTTPNNPNLALMAALGPCGSLTPQTFININELTTVGSVYALAAFMTGPLNIGTSSANGLGLTNAFAAVNSVVNITTGGVGGSSLPAGATLPIAKINTLADVLANCINSSGGSAGDNSACGNLFSNTTVNGVAPTDTITAAMNMAHAPHQNVAALTNSATATAPFQPTLSSPPNDLNIVIKYAAGGFSTPRAVAIDTAGNVWVPNTGTSTVTEMTATGSLLSPTLGYSFSSINAPVAIATDQSGNAWVANSGATTTTKILASGASSTAYTVGTTPSSVAIDAYGSAFITNSGSNSISKISSAGLVTTTVVPGATAPIALAINPK